MQSESVPDNQLVMKGFLLFAPSYDPENGGAIVMHKLCSLLNDSGYEAYLFPRFHAHEVSRVNWAMPSLRVLKSMLVSMVPSFRQNPSFNTRVLRHIPEDLNDGWIVVYPDVTYGNPLGAENVVRWFLHRPGYHTGRIGIAADEYHVDFNEFLRGIVLPNCYRSQQPLYVIHIPSETYNLDGALPSAERSGTAYCMRKGKGRPMVHDLQDSVMIDGLGHPATAAIFKRVKTFISYDPYTAYSRLAVLCGADSVVVPDADCSIEDWYANPVEHYGVAYGFNDLERARATAHLMVRNFREVEDASLFSARSFAVEATGYFEGRSRRNGAAGAMTGCH